MNMQIEDIQDYFRRRSDVEKKYGEELESLSRRLSSKHGHKFLKDDSLSTGEVLQQLIEETGRTGRVHQTLAEVFGQNIQQQCSQLETDMEAIYRKVK